MTAQIAVHTAEIARLRAITDEHNREAVIAAQTMASKADVQRVSDQVMALRLGTRP